MEHQMAIASLSRVKTPFSQVPVNEDWLALRTETAIDPDLPIIDPHHHLWDWAPNERYLFDEVMADATAGHRVVSTVYVDCNAMVRADGDPDLRPVGETEFVNGVAAMTASGNYGPIRLCAGIVGHADLRLGADVERVLEAHLAAGGGRFRGIRNSSGYNPDNPRGRPQHLLGDAAFRAGFARLARHGLSFDAWMYHHQLIELVDLARAFPETSIVLNHTGTPQGIGRYADHADEVFAEWKAAMTALALCDNVTVKLGGLAMGVCGFDFHLAPLPPSSDELVEKWRPYIETSIELFGASRSMFESNFPADKGSCSYVTLWNAFKKIAAGTSADEKQALFAGTAALVYRLPDSVWRVQS
jgi:predicted TIM-barrel fold metal-dependent hydrolase